MIALCAEHHNQADQGKFTPEQLRHLKRTPNPSLAKFGWQRNDLVIFGGGIFYIKPRTILRVKGTSIFGFTRDAAGVLQLNATIQDHEHGELVSIIDNALILNEEHVAIDDIAIPPHGQSLVLKAPSLGVFFHLRFRNVEEDQFPRLFGAKMSSEDETSSDLAFLKSQITNHIARWPITICEFALKMRYPVSVNIMAATGIPGANLGFGIAIDNSVVFDIA